ncbi:MAG: hypothetical protein FWE67_08455 [Planctomycetaceae bacterium]|nr:hypothetical protein [Planctomycetaceae bacterium]
MHTRLRLFLALLSAVLLVFGTTGCRSNGGSWYSPKTYSFYNPISKSSNADSHSKEGASFAKQDGRPSLDAQPNISAPPGGYANPGKESDFFANKQGQKVVQPQYGIGQGNETPMTTAANPYSVPESAVAVYPSGVPAGAESYNPYAAVPQGMMAAPYGTTEPATPSGFQPTRYYEPQNAPVQQVVPAGADTVPLYGNPIAPASTPAVQPQQYNYPAAPSPYGNAPMTYGVPAATPAETAPGYMSAPAGYTASPSSYQPVSGGTF